MNQRKSFADQSYSVVFGGLTLLGLLILIGPVFIVLITSFTTSASLRFPPPDLSLRWYQALFDTARSAHIHRAAGNSLWVASMATLGASILAVFAALAIGRSRKPAARALEAAFLSPLILPSLAYGLATLMFFAL
ncbi:MAG: ABC transporter permease, partial [Acetobacteraceae bacterium]|nr:ABC transporter permease [Acetobacteraceae bacterium]